MDNHEAIVSLKTLCHTCDLFPKCVHEKPECFQAIELAVSALEKQIPKKLQNLHRFRGREKCVGTCPTCGYACCSDYGDYCGGCGQAIDWTEVEL